MSIVDTIEKLAGGWRKKDVHRFANPDLVAVYYETDCREVFDYHEAICDQVEIERRNGVCVSLLTLATRIHDTPRGDFEAWAKPRILMLETMRDRRLVHFDGDVDPHREIVVSLPERTYRRWHNGPVEMEKDPATGKFVGKKTPASTVEPVTDHYGTTTDPHGSTTGPPEEDVEVEETPPNPPAAEIRPVANVDWAGEDRPRRVSVDRIDRDERQRSIARIAGVVADVLEDPRRFAESVVTASRREPIRGDGFVLPLSDWELAVDKLVVIICTTGLPDGTNPLQLLRGLVRTIGGDASVKAGVAGSASPDATASAAAARHMAALEARSQGVAS